MFFHELSGIVVFCELCPSPFPHDSHFREAREGNMEYQLTKPRDNSRKRTLRGSEANVFFLRVDKHSYHRLCELCVSHNPTIPHDSH